MITSADSALVGTFPALATIKATFLIELGFAIAFGILLDTIVVRSVLVTALNQDLGWWNVAVRQAGAKARSAPRSCAWAPPSTSAREHQLSIRAGH